MKRGNRVMEQDKGKGIKQIPKTSLPMNLPTTFLGMRRKLR
jgi:hypothetical protein